MSEQLPSVQSPLFAPVEIEIYTYFTSQYFQRQYQQQKAEDGQTGKFAQHKHFRDKIRSIDSYDKLVEGRHVLVLAWEKVKEGPADFCGRLQPLFKATGYYDLMLLDATAQLELTHHLDDELSKEIAYRHSKMTAQASPVDTLALAEQAVESWKRLAATFHAPVHIALQEAVKYVDKTYHVDLRPLLLASPTQETIPDHERMLEPTELAQHLNYPSAMAFNKALEQAGWQQRRMRSWEATEEGRQHSTRHAWINGGKTGYNLKWNLAAVEALLTAIGTV